MQTVKDIPRLETCTSPQFFCTSYRHLKKNTAINMTLRVTRCGFWNDWGNDTLSWIIICTPVGNCILSVKQGLQCLDLKTGISLSLTHTHTHTNGVALSKLDRFLWRSAFYPLCFVTLIITCYNCTTTYTIYHLYSSLFFDYYWSIMVLNATSAQQEYGIPLNIEQ